MIRGIRGIIFDLDGVLCSTDQYHFLAWRAIAEEIGIPFDETLRSKLRGVSRMDSLNILLGEHSDVYTTAEKEHMAEKKNQLYCRYLSGMSEQNILPEVRDMLNRLKGRYRLAVGSSSKNAGFILAKTKLESCFDAIADGNEIRNSKPDPEVFILAASKLSLLPEECIVLEDAPAGLLAAKAGGFASVAVGKSVEHSEADFHIQKTQDFSELFD